MNAIKGLNNKKSHRYRLYFDKTFEYCKYSRGNVSETAYFLNWVYIYQYKYLKKVRTRRNYSAMYNLWNGSFKIEYNNNMKV